MRTSFGIRTFLIALGCAVLTYFATFLFRPRFAATESLYFLMNQDSAGALGMKPTLQDGGVSSLNGALTSPLVGARIQTAIGILESKSCAQYLAQHAHLADHYGLPEEKAIGLVKQRLRTDSDKNGFLRIDFEDEDKDTAKLVLQEAQNYLSQMSEKLSLNASKKNREFIERRLAQAKKDLVARQNALAKDMGRSPSANPELLQENLLDFRKEYEEAKNKSVSAHAEIRASKLALNKILSGSKSFSGKVIVLNSIFENLSYLTEDLQKRRLALVDAAALYQPNDPELRAVEQNQANADRVINSLVEEEKRDVANGAAPSLATAQATLASLDQATSAFASLMSKLNAEYGSAAYDAATIESAHRDFGSAQTRVTMLEGELETALIAEARNPDRFQVLDTPDLTGEVAFPKRSMLALLVFVIILAAQLVLPKGGQNSQFKGVKG